MDLLQDQKILLCVCGGVAAYKAAALVRRLADAGAGVQVAMTANAERFVTATTFQALSGRPVRTSLWDAAAEAAMGHIELARWPDRIVIAPGIERVFDFDLGCRPNLWRVPAITFSGYHPDFCILAQDGPLSAGPLGLYHSAIAHAAFRAGFGLEETVALYGAEAYRALGYFDRWVHDRDGLLGRFGDAGFDLAPSFMAWTRVGPFMLTSNRPKVFCLKDLARLLLQRAGLPVRKTGLLAPDAFADGPVCPVYPEIAAALSVRGNLWFKREARCQLIDLRRFVEECFDLYARCDDLTPQAPNFSAQLERTFDWARSRR